MLIFGFESMEFPVAYYYLYYTNTST